MSSNRNRLPSDWQEIFINRVRTVGVWCDVNEGEKLRHYFISRHSKASIAISKCGQYVAPFEKLHENQVKQKCLVCDLYVTGSMEVNDIINARLDEKIESIIQTQTQNKE